jgi:tetratricopeptide (TPR) repeat protein
MRIDASRAGYNLSLIPNSASRRRMGLIALVVAVAFINLEVGGAIGLAVNSASAVEAAQPRTLAVKVFPKKPADEGLSKAVYVVLRGAADRMVGQGYSRAVAVPTKAAAAVRNAWDLVNKGRALLKENKILEAFAVYSEAEKAIRDYPGYADRALVGHIYKGLGVGFLAASKPQQAKKAIKMSLFAYPSQVKSEYSYNKEIENFYLSAQREIIDSPKGAMDVESVPAGVEVYVDFVFKGYSPLTVSDLVVGNHLVTFVADGYEPFAQYVEITGGPNELAMGEMVELDNAATITAANSALARAIEFGNGAPKAGVVASLMGATDLIAVAFGEAGDSFKIEGLYLGNGQVKAISSTISKDADVMAEVEGIIGTSMSTMPPKVLTLAPLEPDMIQVVTKAIGEESEMAFAADSELIIDPNSPLFKDANKRKGPGVVKKWWFWTAIILGLGAVGGLTYWGVKANSGESSGGPTGAIQINLGGVR